MVPDWTVVALVTSLAVVLECPLVHACSQAPPTPPWELEPYKSRVRHCVMRHWVPTRPPPAYFNPSSFTFWSNHPRYPAQLLCLINILTSDRLRSSKRDVFITEGEPVRLSCHQLEDIPRNIHIIRDHFPGFRSDSTGLYYWTKDKRQFCERWERTHRHYKCDAAVDRSAPDGEMWIKSVTAADEGVYACAYIENLGKCAGNWCSLRGGREYHLHVTPKKTMVLDTPVHVTSAVTKPSTPISHTETAPPVSSASVITSIVALWPAQWFSTVSTNGVQWKEHATGAVQTTASSSSLTSRTAQSTTFQSVPSVETSAMPLSAALPDSETIDDYSEEDYSDNVGEILKLVAPTVATRAPRVADSRRNATSTGSMASPSPTTPDTAPMAVDGDSAEYEDADIAYAEGLSMKEKEGKPPFTVPRTEFSTTIVDGETVSTAGMNETEYDADYDHAPGDQRRASSFPPECPPCTGNCPCPLFKRKRKHL
ncbi:uncharacterized protein LOC129597006 isoform X2 [Paramacrobiotus metropolitanus]|uniref:uncharacterized protein LOC129597006 isoform X2 n=1 Tax=Paramacrobiotus metropolitanus TaxID=2943436 RepID=UPI002445CB07|nr:uncharacterized protein LOC129597006 isoform X2 [Paramacrobiotus metropolitanus]